MPNIINRQKNKERTVGQEKTNLYIWGMQDNGSSQHHIDMQTLLERFLKALGVKASVYCTISGVKHFTE